MPSLHYTDHFQTVTVTQVKPALVVDLNGSMCVILRGSVTLLLTRVEHGSECPALNRLLYRGRGFHVVIWTLKSHSKTEREYGSSL